ncbi:MAG TPA: hydantoinase B/oxoprolinase family protein [Xanthobacteraceae bacterium]|nr:hydantoinase B/oxoprolinase family protein [Xanthobacteraceae bacterium]
MVDKVKLQILADHSTAAAESMASTLYRTAFSAFVKEVEDFTVGLTTPTGETFAGSRTLGSTWFVGLDYRNLIDLFSYEPGDICITSDPYRGHVCTHSPDIHLWKPVFDGDRIVCFAVGHIHNTDVGGAVAASLSRTLTELHQEGIRIPPMKLFKAGVLNEEIIQIAMTNVRAPEQNWGDLKALIAAVNTGERAVQRLVTRFGAEEFSAGVEGLLGYSEEQTRGIIRTIPDGTYSFEDYIDEDSEGGYPCRLALDMIVEGDSVVMDFRRSDPQLGSSLNVPTGGFERHTLLLIAIYMAFYTLKPGITINTGMTRPFRCITAKGSVLNPEFPAAVGMRSLTATRLQDVVFGCLAQALPDRMPAAPAGSISILNVLTSDPRTGQRVMAALNPLVGGGGGMPHADGSDGSGGNAGYLKNTPVEINEVEVPVRILEYRLAADSGGAGLHRGGLGTTMRFQVFSPETIVTARNRDRTRFRAWGMRGGRAGKPSRYLLNPGTNRERDLGNTDVFRAEPDDVIILTSSGAGGWGDPFARPPGDVLADWRKGSVSEAAAASEYGVAIRSGAVDQQETARLRHNRTRGPEAFFDFGPERDEFESIWSRETYDAFVRQLLEMPTSWRFFLKHKVAKELAGYSIKNRSAPGAVQGILARFIQRYPALSNADTRR